MLDLVPWLVLVLLLLLRPARRDQVMICSSPLGLGAQMEPDMEGLGAQLEPEMEGLGAQLQPEMEGLGAKSLAMEGVATPRTKWTPRKTS